MYEYLLIFVDMQHICSWWLQSPEEGIGSTKTGVTNDCEQPHRFWELNLSLFQEQQIPLSV